MVPPGLRERQAAPVGRLAAPTDGDRRSTLRPRPFILHRLACAPDERIMHSRLDGRGMQRVTSWTGNPRTGAV